MPVDVTFSIQINVYSMQHCSLFHIMQMGDFVCVFFKFIFNMDPFVYLISSILIKATIIAYILIFNFQKLSKKTPKTPKTSSSRNTKSSVVYDLNTIDQGYA